MNGSKVFPPYPLQSADRHGPLQFVALESCDLSASSADYKTLGDLNEAAGAAADGQPGNA
jgi:hypothetical protein